MQFVSFISENYSTILAAIIIVFAAATQVGNIKEWLVLMCAMAEEQFGGGTGIIKARAVYDKFSEKYKIIGKIMPYPVFEIILEWALKKMEATIKFEEAEGGEDDGDK